MEKTEKTFEVKKDIRDLLRYYGYVLSIMVLVVVSLLILTVLLSVWVMESGPPHAITRMNNIQEGMSQEEVFSILDQPQSFSSDGQTAYYYKPLSASRLVNLPRR